MPFALSSLLHRRLDKDLSLGSQFPSPYRLQLENLSETPGPTLKRSAFDSARKRGNNCLTVFAAVYRINNLPSQSNIVLYGSGAVSST